MRHLALILSVAIGLSASAAFAASGPSMSAAQHNQNRCKVSHGKVVKCVHPASPTAHAPAPVTPHPPAPSSHGY
jgi:hypothetical protein